MQSNYLEMTFRSGKLLAAYLYLPRKPLDHSARVDNRGSGLIVDLTEDGRPMGIEMTMPALVTVEKVNEILTSYGLPAVDSAELAPLQKAA